MHVVKAKFERIRELTVDSAINNVGVYVLWAPKNWIKPTYIGEGTFLQRCIDHHKGRRSPMEGFAALLGDKSKKKNKRDAQIVEALLLEVAADVRRSPSRNRKAGNSKSIKKLFDRNDVIRVKVSGFDPLLDPSYPRMKTNKFIRLRMHRNGEITFRHGWKTRTVF